MYLVRIANKITPTAHESGQSCNSVGQLLGCQSLDCEALEQCSGSSLGAAVELLNDELPVLTEAEGLGSFFLTADCPTDITAEETLCMKADLVLPWNKVHNYVTSAKISLS